MGNTIGQSVKNSIYHPLYSKFITLEVKVNINILSTQTNSDFVYSDNLYSSTTDLERSRFNVST
jgi:hypothetical protein